MAALSGTSARAEARGLASASAPTMHPRISGRVRCRDSWRASQASGRQAITASLQWLWDRFRETGGGQPLARPRGARAKTSWRMLWQSLAMSPTAPSRLPTSLRGATPGAAAPSQAKCFLVIMRAMFRWALQVAHVKVDPTVGIKAFPKKKNGGFLVWSMRMWTAIRHTGRSAPSSASG